MSRESVSNDRYTLAFGVDHTPMGCFFQLWEKAAKGEDPESDGMGQPQIQGDEHFGMAVHNPNTVRRNRELETALRYVTLRNEETVIKIGKACGLNVVREVHELWN